MAQRKKSEKASGKQPEDPFAALYPSVAAWVQDGWVEIGRDDFGRSFVRALDIGGMIWEGEEEYSSVHEALQALDAGIAEWLEESSFGHPWSELSPLSSMPAFPITTFVANSDSFSFSSVNMQTWAPEARQHAAVLTVSPLLACKAKIIGNMLSKALDCAALKAVPQSASRCLPASRAGSR